MAEVGPSGRVVECHGELDEAGAGEQDDADLVACELRHHVVDLKLGAFEAGGLQVLGQHTERYVEGDHDLHAALLDDLDVAAPLWAGQGEDDEGDADEPQGEPASPHPPVDGQAEPFDEGRVADASHRSGATREGPPDEGHQRGKGDQGV